MSQEKTSAFGRPLKLVVGLGILVAAIWFVYAIRGMLAPFAVAFVLAYILAPVIDRMEGRGLSRTWSILLVFLVAFCGLGGGAFLVGDRVTDQMVQMSDRLLRQEAVDRQLVITNMGNRQLVIKGIDWEDQSEMQPFLLLDIFEFPLRISPGREQAVRLRFAPQDISRAQNALRLDMSGSSGVKPFVLRVRGNASAAEEGSEPTQEDEFWAKGEYGSKIRLQTVVLSASGIDFGKAGPNIFTEIGKMAATIQPHLQAYLGANFDLAVLIKEQGSRLMDTMIGGSGAVLGGVVSGLTFLVLVPFVAFFFLKEGRSITRGLIELVPNAYFELCLNLIHQIDGQIGGYIRGQVLETSAVAALSVGGLYLIGMDYALPLGLLAGLANMIPFLGPLIGIISASIVALGSGGGLALIGKVIVLFLVIQMIDNVLIQPTILARSVEMHPLVVLFVVMVGSQLMGIVGMLIAVPLTGILKVSGQTIYQGIRSYHLQ